MILSFDEGGTSNYCRRILWVLGNFLHCLLTMFKFVQICILRNVLLGNQINQSMFKVRHSVHFRRTFSYHVHNFFSIKIQNVKHISFLCTLRGFLLFVYYLRYKYGCNQ